MQKLSPARLTGKEEIASNPLIEAALSYARRGWQVFPVHTPSPDGCSCRKSNCYSIGKHPRTQHGYKDATISEQQILEWWTRWPDANIGIATGPRSGFFVLDIDGANGQASLKTLEGIHTLPHTLRVLTGRTDPVGERAGYHLYFSWPIGANLGNSAPRGLGKGLDIRGAGGYVVAPPSLHASGLLYEWADSESAVADPPAWLVAALSETSTIALPVLRTSLFYRGERNTELFRLAAKWHRDGVTRAELERKLLAANQRRCVLPLDSEEVRKIAANAAKLEPLGPDALEIAWHRVEEEEYPCRYNQLVALARHLDRASPGCPILLPVERIAKLMGCDRTTVGKYRKIAVAENIIEEVGTYIPQKIAKRYRVLPLV